MEFTKKLLQANVTLLLSGISGVALATCTSYISPGGENTYECNNGIGETEYTPINGYDHVIINTTATGDFRPIQGFGVYVNNHTWNIDRLTITTSGSKADAIQVNGGGGTITIDKLNIHTTGSSADGINVTKNVGNGRVEIGNNAIVIADDGMGLRVNTPTNGGFNQIRTGDDAKISTAGDGSNLEINFLGQIYEFGTGYGVYAGNTSSSAKGNARLTVGNRSNISTAGLDAHAVYANKGGVIQLGSTTVNTNQSNAYGLYAETGGTGNGNKGGIIDLLGDTSVTVPAGGLAIYANGAGSKIASYNSDISQNTSGKFTVTGDIKSNNGGKVDLRMTDGSVFIGNSDVTGTGSVLNLDIVGANSKWQMSADSKVTNLNVNGGNIYVGPQTSSTAAPTTLTVEKLSGNNMTFHVRTDIIQSGPVSTFDVSDKLIVTDTATGNHRLMVTDYNTGGATPMGNEMVTIAEIADGNAHFTLANANGYVDLGPYQYVLGQRSTRGPGQTYWHLRAGSGSTNTANHSANVLNINYLLGFIENQTLLQRMGELRRNDNQQGNAWVRAYTGTLDSFENKVLQGFDMDYTGLQAGVDKHIEAGNGDVYVGVMAGYTQGKAHYKVGDGKSKGLHVGVYGTYKTEDNWYVDGFVKYLKMDNQFNTETGSGWKVKGDGDTSGYSIGVEAGKRFYVQQPQKGWYVEPQAQLTYTHQGSATIKASNGLKTDLNSFDSLIGRASVIVGYSVSDGDTPVDVYFKTGYLKEFDGKTGFSYNNASYTHKQYKFNGNWWDNGIGVNAQIKKNHNVYLDGTYSIGNKFDRKQVNLGYRYSF